MTVAANARILIIDDEQKNVDALGQILSRAGYAICISITDPRKAVSKFAEIRPDILLLDWHMDPLSGLDVLEAIKKAVPGKDVPPVLVLTADDSPDTKRAALAAGATDFLSKPFDHIEVLLRIRNLIQLRMLLVEEENINLRLEKQVGEKTAELENAMDELKQTQHQVVEQERLRALGTMAGGITHDFNNTLTIIRGYADMFMSKEEVASHPDEATRAFAIIRRASKDATHVVKRLREFYRRYKKGEDDHHPVDINSVVAEAVHLTLPRWKTQPQAKGIFVDVKVEAGEPRVISASATELREVLMNLIFNAVDAMLQGGVITIRTGEEDGRVFLEVEDNGTGMTEDTRQHCLEPFYTTKGENGTGLGLATTNGIVRRHGGIIQVETVLNEGTRFKILLPFGKPLKRSVPAQPASVPHSHPLKVLVVDDQPDICDVLSHYLEEDSHVVETAFNGCEALEKFRAGYFDVVITDRAMPKMNGNQLATAIKEIQPREPVILLTAFSDEPGQQTRNVDMVLDKPVSLDKIRQAIHKVVAA